MDYSLIGVAATAMSMAKELGKAALSVRDHNETATVIAQMNDQLLKAQEALFRHNAELLSLQQEQFETTQKLRKLEEALAERGRYSLVELATGIFAYRMNVTPVSCDVSEPVSSEPVHHVCQPCFDKGVKAVLKRTVTWGTVELSCPVCSQNFDTGERERSR